MQIERDFVIAAKTRDMACVERTLAKEYAQAADAKPVNVAAQLAGLTAGLVQIEFSTMREVRAHVFDDAAIVSMEARSKAFNGKPVYEKSRSLDVFEERDGRWQVVNSQMTTIKE